MLALIKSRKFKLTVIACLGAVTAALNGKVSWEQALYAGICAIAANILGIAIEDASAKLGSGIDTK